MVTQTLSRMSKMKTVKNINQRKERNLCAILAKSMLCGSTDRGKMLENNEEWTENHSPVMFSLISRLPSGHSLSLNHILSSDLTSLRG